MGDQRKVYVRENALLLWERQKLHLAIWIFHIYKENIEALK